ncbi:hypothetical protein HYH02_010594 [Chlamydomonas schloesseri]|uniref:Amidohydrolase-related domain-containing protein n=1 Tax=Chlamydomonas schloesseri TaxID=2026947 RepID=A0A835TL51_9CHLO|nr:hypothetical protein HYH02_010594 [Chlamydomonas schloesseri]|eukprot:KAG2439715.1 hypothetical protein HYH02_010594 [Chlamydomonas schloesseri]
MSTLWLRLPTAATEPAAPENVPTCKTDANLLPPELLTSSFAKAASQRRHLRAARATSNAAAAAAAAAAAGAEGVVLLVNAVVLDTQLGEYLPGLQRVALRDGVIAALGPMPGQEQPKQQNQELEQESPEKREQQQQQQPGQQQQQQQQQEEEGEPGAQPAAVEAAAAAGAATAAAAAAEAGAEAQAEAPPPVPMAAEAEAELEAGVVAARQADVEAAAALLAGLSPLPSDPRGPLPAAPAVVVDCAGAVLMPGLCDAHVHCTAITADLAALRSHSEAYVAARAAVILGGMLARGFTTVRDAGGADFGLAQAVEEGIVLGPKILFTGHALSQTGGHGDFRGRGEDACACGAALRGIGRVCDGIPEVRKAARDELRRGAHCIKIMASGGVASPTDRLTNTQFSESELKAIVEEAEAAGTYVCAHAYTPAAILRAVRCGVRSIEHGNYLDPHTATEMAFRGAYLVPTLVTYQELGRGGEAAGMPKELVAKVGDALEAGLRSLGVARDHGVVMCFGSDLLGDLHPAQADELCLRARVLPAVEVIKSATVHCAELFNATLTLGRVRPGFAADLLLLAPGVDPLADVAALAAPGGGAVAAVWREGLLAKAPYGPGRRPALRRGAGGEVVAPGGDWWEHNERLF